VIGECRDFITTPPNVAVAENKSTQGAPDESGSALRRRRRPKMIGAPPPTDKSTVFVFLWRCEAYNFGDAGEIITSAV